MLNFFLKKINRLDENTLDVLKKSVSSIFVKVCGMIAAFGISVFLGRSIGASGLGVVNLANQIVMVLLVLAMFGMQHVLVKNIAISHRQNTFQNIKNSVKTAIFFNGSLAIIIATACIILTYLFANDVFNNPLLTTPLIIFLIAILPQTLSRVYAAAINGVGKVWQSNLFEQVLTSVFVLLALLIGYLYDISITIINVAILYVSSRFLVFIIAFTYWKRVFLFPKSGNMTLKPMLQTALPLLLVSSTSVLATNADTIMLGFLSDTEAVGLYSVASRIAMLTSFMLLVSNSAISPKLAYMYSEGNLKGMQKMVKQTTLGVIITATIFLMLFLFFGNYILSIWGEEFRESYVPLIILCVGQFINVSTGCSGLLLIMCGYEKLHRNISFISVTLNILLNFIGIHYFGIVGAALATAFTIGTENILKVYFAKKKMGIWTIPI